LIPEIGNLVNLEEIFLKWNRLLTVPPEIGKLMNLRKLDLKVNPLSYLPREICKLTNLEELGLPSIINVPNEIESKGPKDILQFIFGC
jgi:Leucine-rich repeat (LRR) protein